jgi:iron complex outermembrane receptor protein
MKKIIIIIIFFCSFGLWANSDLKNKEIIVKAPKKITEQEELERYSSFVDIIDLSTDRPKYKSLGEILSERVGISLKKYGSSGSFSSISIRGSNFNQVAIYLDGLPLNNNQTSEINLEEFPLDNLEKIEIYRSNSPGRLNSNAIGGTINLISRQITSKPCHQISLGYGSYQTTKANFYSSQKKGNLGYSLFFSRKSSQGDFKFKDDNGTPLINKEDDSWQKRKNNESTSYSLTAKGLYTGPKINLTFFNNLFFSQKGLPGMNNNNIQKANSNLITAKTILTIKPKNLFKNRYRLTTDFFYSFRLEEIKDPDYEIGFNSELEKKYYNSWGSKFYNQILIPNLNQTLSLLLATQFEVFYKKDRLSTDQTEEKSPTQKRLQLNFILEDQISLFRDRWLIIPQLKYDFYQNIFTKEFSNYFSHDNQEETNLTKEPSGQLGQRFFLYQSHKSLLSLKNNLSYKYRQPTFIELFGDQGYLMGNSDLKAEKSFGYDLGLSFKKSKPNNYLDNLKLEYVFFKKKVDEIISFISNSQWTSRPENISQAKIYGHELSSELLINQHFLIKTNYTYQRAIDKSDLDYYYNKDLPFRPCHQFYLKTEWFNHFLKISYELNYTGTIFRDRLNSKIYYLKKKDIHHLNLALNPFKNFTLKMEVNNFTNNLARDDIGYPLPGRSYFLTGSYLL